MKCIRIDLPEGETVRQPMTGSFHRGSLLDAQREAMAIGQELARRGFDVVRTKIEQHGRLDDAPESDADAARAPKTSYFEFHAKVVLAADSEEASVREVLARAGGHLSANAARGGLERFLTLRAFGLGRASAFARFEALLAAVASLGLPIRNRVHEYTVYDSNPEIDRGCIDA